LNKRQYCIIVNPVGENGKPRLGTKIVVRGEKQFFLKPGEKLEGGVKNVVILAPDEALWLKANEGIFLSFPFYSVYVFSEFVDENGSKRKPGHKWLVYGPKEYW